MADFSTKKSAFKQLSTMAAHCGWQCLLRKFNFSFLKAERKFVKHELFYNLQVEPE